ncbi:MAG: hypothetical protein LQ344_004621 [Seirophora lacunosa]|nr:MAG: hypothetical protein LQ344_004621 [Seirophora lacunosa]
MANVLFIPPQMGPITKYAGRYIRSGPLWLMFKDLCILITVLPYLPLMFFPMGTTDKRKKGLRFQSIRDSVIQVVLSVLELVLSILFLPALVSLPGILFLALAIACVLLIGLLAWPTQGPRVVEATIDERTLRRSQQHPGERWVFVNGVCTGSSGLQQNIDRLSLLFGRKVLGIHNQSYGLISDLLECIVQRCLSYSTEDVRVACEVLRDYLVDEEVKKVVLVAHSQGGIIVSMVVDYLLAELSGEMMGKLEIYTFGSAAAQFNNPPRTSTTQSSPSIPHIEHYANEYDMVPRWGVLYAIRSLLTDRYAGEVFVRTGATGHMFVEHYLDPIFPLPGHQSKDKSTGSARARRVNADADHGVDVAEDYLDAIVDVDTDTEKRRAGAEPKSVVHKHESTVHKMGEQRIAPEMNGLATPAAENGDANATIDARANLTFVKGKKVKELSRLWKYLDGAVPLD